MKALVTGGSGFIGSRLIPFLHEKGVSVRVLLRKTSKVDHLSQTPFERVEGDLMDEQSLRKAVKGVDVVFHLAAVLAGNSSGDYFRSNQTGTENLMKAVVKVNPGLARFVFVSSLAAGGPSLSSSPRTEDETDSPVSFYGQSKLAAEKSIEALFSSVPVAILRPPIVYGPRDRATLLLAKVAQKKFIPLVKPSSSSIQKMHSIIHVDDLVEALWLVGSAPKGTIVSGTRYYVTGQEDLTYRNVMQGYSDAIGVRPVFMPIPPSLLRVPAKICTLLGKLTGKTFLLNDDKYHEIVPDYWICSSQKIQKDLGYDPKVKFTDGVRSTVDWYQKEGWL